MSLPDITILPAPGCRRSRRILEYLEQQGISFTRVPLDSQEGAAMAEKYNMRASPGILVDGVNVNPFDLLIQPACRVDAEKAQAIFLSDDMGKTI
jgi:glutaredoxin